MAQAATARGIDRRPWVWAASATFIIYIWTLVFWYLFFQLFAWEVLQVPMGQGGAIYPVFFTVPVIACTAVYEMVVAAKRFNSEGIRQRYLSYTLWIPLVVVTVALIVFCPMDTQMSFLTYVITQRLF